jgi:NADH-quinone oxidoreductase subunit J
MLMSLIFFSFKFLLVLNAMCVILAKNPVHSVLHLVVVFLNAASLLLFLEADFMSLILIVVYVGAIAVLFLFICMMLNIRLEQESTTIFSYMTISGIFGLILIFELSFIFYDTFVHNTFVTSSEIYKHLFLQISIIRAIGDVLYSFFGVYFLLASLILLLAMVGAIFLTLHHRIDVRRQSIFVQTVRKYMLDKFK